MPIAIVREEPYWPLVGRLRDYEGWRMWWRVPAGGLVAGVLMLAPFAAALASTYLSDDIHSTLHVLIGAVLAVLVGQRAAPLLAAKPWRSLIVGRLRGWEQATDGLSTPVLLRADDVDRLSTHLRRAGLSGHGSLHRVGLAPPGAPDLALAMDVRLAPQHGPRLDGQQLNERVLRVAQEAGVRARVAGMTTTMRPAARAHRGPSLRSLTRGAPLR